MSSNITDTNKNDSLQLCKSCRGKFIPCSLLSHVKQKGKKARLYFILVYFFHNNFLTVEIILHNALHS